MNFELDDSQRELALIAKEFLDQQCSTRQVREIEKAGGFSPELYRATGEQGFLGLFAPESLGGAGLGWLETALFFQEAGRHLFPGPLVSSNVWAAKILLDTNETDRWEELLVGVFQGERIVGVAWSDYPDGLSREVSELRTRAVPRPEGGWIISGRKLGVPYATVSDEFLVVAAVADESGTLSEALFLVARDSEGLSIEVGTAQDGSELSDVVLQNVTVDGERRIASGEAVAKVLGEGRAFARIAPAAYASGAATQSLDLAVEYAKTRHQFDRPIGSFQAIQHKLANVACLVQEGHWLAHYAAEVADRGFPIEQISAMAKLRATDALKEASLISSLTHGGNGFTEDYDIQLYFRKAKPLEFLLGSPVEERRTALVGLFADNKGDFYG